MQHDIRTRVLRYEVKTAQDGNSIRHVVSLSGGVAGDGTQYPAQDYVTFQPELGQKAFSLQGQDVDARVEIKQVPKKRGQGFFTNFDLHDIAAPGTLVPMAMPTAGGTPAQPVQAAPQMPAPMQESGAAAAAQAHPHPALAEQETQKSEERRRSAMHAAFDFVAVSMPSGEFKTYTEALRAAQQLTDALVHYIGTGTWGDDQAQAAPVTPAEQTPQAVAQAVNEAAGQPVVAPGVPFDQPNPAA